ncbi:MAG: apolipoprotein N-acyltransferase [Armatimonadota bacterium]|nr:MAG: apolipoprotein N-acyltransferase [Armatimonadota bacterium]
MRTAAHLAICVASGVVLALAYPRFDLWPLAWVALVPWLVVAFTASWPILVVGSWLAGFAFFAALMYWVAIFGYLPWALLALIQGLAFVLTAAAARVIAPRSAWRVLAVGVAWAAFEFARGAGEFGVPWGQVGHSQAPFLRLAQLAAFGGVPLISFVVVTVNAAAAHAIAARREGSLAYQPMMYAGALAATAVALGGVHAAGVQRALRADRQPSVRVGIAQASIKSWLTVEQLNVPLTLDQQRAELSAYQELTRDATAQGAELVIWPESAVPGYLDYEGLVRERVTSAARAHGIWMLVGGPAYEDGRGFNSAYAVSPRARVTGRYDKVHLVPFGEYVPWRKWLPLLRHYRVRDTDITRGVEHRVLRVGRLAVGPMICFESVFPHIARQEANRGAQTLCIITNDAWFLRTAAAAQHLQIGRFRAIEEGLYVARGAATGISCFFDPLGRVMSSLGLMERGVVVADIKPRAADTLYRRLGPVFSMSCAIGVLAWAAAALVRRRSRRTSRR